MKKVEITINGEAYPCRPTMGAMLRFKKETGREVTEIDPASLSDLCTYLWCCIVSACAAEKKEFGLSLMEFADSLTSGEMDGWTQSITEDAEAGGEADGDEKKS